MTMTNGPAQWLQTYVTMCTTQHCTKHGTVYTSLENIEHNYKLKSFIHLHYVIHSITFNWSLHCSVSCTDHWFMRRWICYQVSTWLNSLFNHFAYGSPSLAGLGQHLPLAVAQQYPHVPGILQSAGQFPPTGIVNSYVCMVWMYMFVYVHLYVGNKCNRGCWHQLV